jgi:virginiamycin B lyase
VKTRKKGILFFVIVAGIMLSSGVTIAINPAQWFGDSSANIDEITDEEFDAHYQNLEYHSDRALQFCTSNEYAMSNEYVKEYKIPTACTQPLAITVDHNGMVWFAQTGTGKVAKFDPLTETFTEYANPVWENIEKQFILKAV